MRAFAIFRPLTARSLLSGVVPAFNRDRQMANFGFKLFKISCLCIFFPLSALFGQISNQEIFEKLVVEYLSHDKRTVKTLTGTLTPAIKEGVRLQEGGAYRLDVETPQIEFEALGERRFRRAVITDLVFSDSTEHRLTLTHTDTLTHRQIPAARKTDLRSLRGEDPRFRARYLRPAIGVAGGIAVIVSLFYIRSAAP